MLLTIMRAKSKRKFTLLGFAVGAAFASGLVLAPPEASAKWVRVSVRATMNAGEELYTSAGEQITGTFNPSFVLRDYTSSTMDSTTASWTQAGNDWSYYPLFDFATLTNTTGFYGNSYNARYTLTSAPDQFSLTDRGTTPYLTLDTGRADNQTGYNVYNDNTSTPKALSSISLVGPIAGFTATNSNSSLGSFIETALGSSGPTTYDCANSAQCQGIITNEENQLYLSWDKITFEVIEPVPAPLPLAGSAAAFVWARKLRRRASAASKLLSTAKI
jgi:hypothetical protein